MSWQETVLGEHIALVSGPAFKSRQFTNDPNDIPLVKGENIGQGMMLWEKSKYWPRDDGPTYEKFILEPGDIVLAMDRPWVSAGLKYAVISERDPRALLVQRVARIRGANGLASMFLRYVISSPQFCAYIKSVMGGTNVPHVSGNQIRSFTFVLPPIRAQRRIADILSAYDDLIENNRRRIQLLEQSARLLYKEWFVHLRFPGHEHVPVVDGVPEGWSLVPLQEVCDRITDGSHSSPASVDDGLPMASVKNMQDWEFDIEACRKISQQDFESLVANDCKPLLNDVVIAKDGHGYLKKTFVMQEDLDLVVLSSVAILRPNERISSHLLNFILRDPRTKAEMSNYVSGVAIPRIVLRDFRNYKILLPTEDIQLRWSERVEAIASQCFTLGKLSKAASKARDLLLSSLMNGEIPV